MQRPNLKCLAKWKWSLDQTLTTFLSRTSKWLRGLFFLSDLQIWSLYPQTLTHTHAHRVVPTPQMSNDLDGCDILADQSLRPSRRSWTHTSAKCWLQGAPKSPVLFFPDKLVSNGLSKEFVSRKRSLISWIYNPLNNVIPVYYVASKNIQLCWNSEDDALSQKSLKYIITLTHAAGSIFLKIISGAGEM